MSYICVAQFNGFILLMKTINLTSLVSSETNDTVQCRYVVAEWYGAGLAIVGSNPPTAAVYQRQLSMPSLRGRLMSTSGSLGVNGHTTRCTGPVSVVLRLRLVFG